MKVNEKLCPGLRSPESNECPSSDEAVWGLPYTALSLFFHITVSPAWIESELGVNE